MSCTLRGEPGLLRKKKGMDEIEAGDLCLVMATCKTRPGVWWGDSKGPCALHLGSEPRFSTKGELLDFTKLELGSGAEIPEKESFRRKVGIEVTFLEHELSTRKKTVHVCFSHAIFWSLWVIKLMLCQTVSSESGTGLLPRAGLAPFPMHLLQGEVGDRHGRPGADENPNRQSSRQRHRVQTR